MTSVLHLKTGEELDLAKLLSDLQEAGKSGTLKLIGDGGRVKYIYFKRGTVELLKTNRSRTLLGKALLKRHKLTQEQLQAALERQKAANNSLRLGEILVGMGIVKESDVHQALTYQIAEEIFELFTWNSMKSEFFRGEPPLDIFESEDLQARVSLSPIQLARESIRRQNELFEIQRTLPSTQDVYAPTARARSPENEANPAIKEVLDCMDGIRTVDELLDVVRAPDLVALRVLVKMVQDGDAVSLSAQEILTQGQMLEEQGEFERAKQRYLRAEALGHPDFDLPRRIGQIAEALGDIEEASRRYTVYADRCEQAGYPEVASQTLQRVLELDGTQHTARERHAELLLKSLRAIQDAEGPQFDAMREKVGEQYEVLLLQLTNPEDQQRILTELVQLMPHREDLRERMAHISLELGDQAQAVLELQELATNALESGNHERAVQILEKVITIDPADFMAHQTVSGTYVKLGQKGEALKSYRRFAKSLEDSGLAAASSDTITEIYEKIVELDPEDNEARRFLAEAYEGKKNAEKAIANYTRIVETLRKQGDTEELLDALDKLQELDPGNTGVVLERTRLARELGRGEQTTNDLRAMAEAAQLQGDLETAESVWSELLGVNPGDLEGHLALAKIMAQRQDEEEAARRCAAVFELALLAGHEDLAYDAVKQAMDLEPDQPEHRERLARIESLRGKDKKAAKILVRAARSARDDEDFGKSRSWARRALQLDPACEDATDLLENLRRRTSDQPAATTPARTGPTVKATITGGGSKGPAIQGYSAKTRRVGNIADRLRNMKLGTPVAPRSSADETVISMKASSAMNKLRAMKSGGGGGGSSDSGGAIPSKTIPAKEKVSQGPEAPGQAADTVVSKKASSALNKLRAMRSGGGGGDDEPAPKKAAKGPEAPGEAADAKVSKKANSALSKLKALRSGGGGGPSPSGGGEPKKAAKGPEAPGEAADAKVSKKATSALSKLKALRAGGGGGASPSGGGETKKASKGPEAPGEAADEKVSQKASSALSRLRALRAGKGDGGDGGGGEAKKKAAKGPEAPGEAADEQVSKKATSAMDRLRALKAGKSTKKKADAGGQKVSKGPEAPGQAADEKVSKKASSAMDRLRALKAASAGGKEASEES